MLLQDRLKKGKEKPQGAIEALALLCEPAEPEKGELEHIHYFCGNTEIPSDLQDCEPQRAALYKATVALTRAYANIAGELELPDIARPMLPASSGSLETISIFGKSSARPAEKPSTAGAASRPASRL